MGGRKVIFFFSFVFFLFHRVKREVLHKSSAHPLRIYWKPFDLVAVIPVLDNFGTVGKT